MFLPALREGDAGLVEFVLHCGFALGGGLAQRRAQLTLGQKVFGVVHRQQAERLAQFVVAARLLGAALLLVFLLRDVERQAFDAVAAVVGHRAAQLAHLRLLLALLSAEPLDLARLTRQFIGQVRQALVEQLGLQHREEGLQRIARGAPLLDLRGQCLTAFAVGHQRLQQGDLALRLQHRFMRAVQVVEVGDQRLQARRHVERFEHVAAHEVGQVADRLHRHGLVKKFQRLVVLDAEVTAKQRAVGREAVFHRHAAGAQALAQLGDVGAELGEVGGDAECALGHRVEPQRRAVRVLEPEHLGQRHGLVVAGVVEHRQDHGVAVRPAQRHWPARAALLVALGLVVTEHVGAQGALARVGAGGLVVGDAVGGHEQGRDRVDECRLA